MKVQAFSSGMNMSNQIIIMIHLKQKWFMMLEFTKGIIVFGKEYKEVRSNNLYNEKSKFLAPI